MMAIFVLIGMAHVRNGKGLKAVVTPWSRSSYLKMHRCLQPVLQTPPVPHS